MQLEHPREGMTADAPRGFPLALGTERFGLLTLRHPLIGAAVFVALAIAAAFGIQRIKVDDSLSQLFRSDTPEFKQYEEVTTPLSVERIRRAGRGRRQDAACSATISKSCATSSPTCSSSTARAA